MKILYEGKGRKDIIKKEMENKTVKLLQIGEYVRKKDEKGNNKK
jgi:hypothetical protein